MMKLSLRYSLIFLLFIITCLSCKPQSLDPAERTPMSTLAPLTIPEIEKMARIKMPANVSNVQVHYVTGWMDDFILLRFELSAAELNSFLQSAGYTELEDRYWSLQDAPYLNWWPRMEDYNNNSERVFAGARVHELGFVKRILVDKTNPELFIIYLQHFET